MPFARSFFRGPPTTPRLVASLRHLAREIDARWPDRATHLDGWIGDAAHAVRLSDHNPDHLGRVHALDVTAEGIDPLSVVTAARRHPGTHYVIFQGTLWSLSAGFEPRPYTGTNPHREHLHISVSRDPRGRMWSPGWFHAN